MSQRLVVLPLAAMLLLFGVLIAACSSDNDDSGNGDTGTDATEPADTGGGDSDGDGDGTDATEPPDDGDGDGDGDGGSSESASATLTVGGELWSFDVTSCAFPNEQSGTGQISFRLSGVGETDDGVPIRLQATIQDIQSEGRLEGDGVIHVVEMVEVTDAGDAGEPVFGWISSVEIFAELEPVINIDGKNLTAATTFDDELTASEFEDVPGTLVATCP